MAVTRREFAISYVLKLATWKRKLVESIENFSVYLINPLLYVLFPSKQIERITIQILAFAGIAARNYNVKFAILPHNVVFELLH